MGETRFAAITTAIIVLSYIVAMTVSSLEKVLAYVGSTGSTSISFILPGLFYYKISSPESGLHQRLVKEDDDEVEGLLGRGEGDEAVGEGEGWVGWRGEGVWAGVRGRSGRGWRRKWVRRASLALALYGGVVMGVCLVGNTFFVVAH